LENKFADLWPFVIFLSGARRVDEFALLDSPNLSAEHCENSWSVRTRQFLTRPTVQNVLPRGWQQSRRIGKLKQICDPLTTKKRDIR
jgi:hypothetical protein